MDAVWLEEPNPQGRVRLKARLKADDRFLYRQRRGKPTKRPSDDLGVPGAPHVATADLINEWQC
eukprot:3427316-Amphidinium_carterae.1